MSPHPATPAYLSYLARWDQSEEALREALSKVAGYPIEFRGEAAPSDARTLFSLFERNPLDAVTQREDGSCVLAFHPWAAYRQVVEERYLGPPKPPLHARVPLPYHLVPGPLRLALYPLVAGQAGDPEACPPSPSWPIDNRIDAMRARLYSQLQAEAEPRSETGSTTEAEAAGAWPDGKHYPLLMTHDIDTRAGMAGAGRILDEMVELGLKPCFFLVGRGYTWDTGFCDAVIQAGGEIGLHGDLHDNRIAYLSSEEAGRRLDTCRDRIERHGIRGFRSPSLLVSDALYEAVASRFAWDSSVPDTDTHTLLGPRRGCGTTFPFRRGGSLVLPTTMPADDRLELLGYKGMKLLEVLRRKWKHVKQTGGLCHFLTHPEPHLFGRAVIRDLYRALLQEIVQDEEAWIATPSMVAEYWQSLEPAPVSGLSE